MSFFSPVSGFLELYSTSGTPSQREAHPVRSSQSASTLKFFSNNKCEEIKILASVFLILKPPGLIACYQLQNTRPSDVIRSLGSNALRRYALELEPYVPPQVLPRADRGRRVWGDCIRCVRIGQAAAASQPFIED